VTDRESTRAFLPEVERAFLAGAIDFPHYLDGITDDLEPEDFADAGCGAAWAAIRELVAEGNGIDRLVALERARRSGAELDEDTLELPDEPNPPLRSHVEIILRNSAARAVRHSVGEAMGQLADGTDPYEVAQAAARDLDRVGLGASRGAPEALTMPELLLAADAAAPWVIDGLLRVDWRAIVVASEGLGKSTLLRQIGMAPAQGIHPLRLEEMEPIRVLIVDAENPKAAIAETGRRLDDQVRATVGMRYDAERCRIWSRPGGLDLRDARDRADLVREIRHQAPQLVVAGPLYKLGPRRDGESYEEAAEGIQRVLDDLRMRFGFALLLEHHAPKPTKGVRDLLPFGSQRWLAWPELGITLKQYRSSSELELGRFRGDRLAASWPDRLVRGREWPFEGRWEGRGSRSEGYG
jgi:replicative DNA helicase